MARFFRVMKSLLWTYTRRVPWHFLSFELFLFSSSLFYVALWSFSPCWMLPESEGVVVSQTSMSFCFILMSFCDLLLSPALTVVGLSSMAVRKDIPPATSCMCALVSNFYTESVKKLRASYLSKLPDIICLSPLLSQCPFSLWAYRRSPILCTVCFV